MRRIPSRRMPTAESMPVERLSVAQSLLVWLVLAVPIASVILLIVQLPWFLVVIGLVVIVSIHLGIVEKERRAALAKERQGESICTFVRSFDFRATDTWILRAVYEGLQSYFPPDEPIVPIRADDDMSRTLGIEDDDFTENLLPIIAYRCGRSLDFAASNPFLRVQSVADLVRFLMNQPRQIKEKPLAYDDFAMDV